MTDYIYLQLSTRVGVDITTLHSLILMGFYKTIGKLILNVESRQFCSSILKMKILNVAEKNDAAKNIAGYLSRGASRRREGLSPYNKIYEFETQVLNQNATMVMTSVSGHLLNYEFIGTFKNWRSCSPLELFDAPVVKMCPNKDYDKIKNTIEREVRSCACLIIWTDCDREGENIGYEIIDVCLKIKPNLAVYRAKFSEITSASVFRALQNLELPNKNVSDAVDVRQELDLRIGAAFTRLQTLRLQQVFPQKLSDNLISYGSCQFPTLGFVVDRYKAIEDFIPQTFWKIKMSHTIGDLTIDFHWGRDRLFERSFVQALLERCQEASIATITSVISKPKNKWRPLPLDTIEMEKSASRKLKINAKTTMKIAEKLYTQGFISYPRTETNIFPKDLNLTNLIQAQTGDGNWGPFATNILNTGGPTPRQGQKSDQAHPPIHPIKYADNLHGDDKRVYEFIVRHFLACCSKDAKGMETIVDAEIGNETFQAKGLMIIEKNYLEVYIYEKWNAKEIHLYEERQQFEPTILDMVEGTTTEPPLLTEADLISLMEKHGIGTDATHADHIATIQSREYVALPDGVHFVPGVLGMGLVEGYDQIGLDVSLAKPNLRAELENDLKRICDGVKEPSVVLREQIDKYREMYRRVIVQMQLIDSAIGTRIDEEPVANVGNLTEFSTPLTSPFKCPNCGHDMLIRSKKNNDGKYIGCSAFPACNNAVWLPQDIKNVTVTDDACEICGPAFKKLRFEFVRMNYGCYTNPHIACLGGCDSNVLTDFNIALNKIRKENNTVVQNRSVDNRRTGDANQNRNPTNAQRNLNQWLSTQQNAQQSMENNSIRSSSNTLSQRNRNSSNNTNQWSRRDNTTIDSGFASAPPSASWGRQSTSFNGGNNILPSDNVGVVCGCSVPAILLSVKKAGPNNGRTFYKCSKGQENGGCNFFLWHSDTNSETTPSLHTVTAVHQPTNINASSSTASNRIPFGNQNTNTVPDNGITCPSCGEPAVRRTVQKDTPNKGRAFYTCPKPQGSQCKFFKWADEVDQSVDAGGHDGDDGWGGGARLSWGTGSNDQTTSWGSNRNNTRGGGRPSSRGKKNSVQNTKKRKFTAVMNPDGNKTRRKCGLCGEEGHTRNRCPHKDN